MLFIGWIINGTYQNNYIIAQSQWLKYTSCCKSVSSLPKAVHEYVKQHYKGAKITEAGSVTDAKGGHSFEAEVNKKDVIFDTKRKFIREE